MEGSPYAERDGAVLHVVFNNPERLNALAFAQHEGVLEILREAEADPDVRVLALSGAGRAFCAGDYIKADAQDWPARLANRRVELEVGVGPILLNEATSALRAFPKPTVALMHGHALGAGYDYASSCDLRLATRGCRIGDPRIGLALWGAEGWSYRLPRLVGQTYVAPLTYAGDLMTGASAAEIGFVHQAFDDGCDLRAAARPLFDRLARLDPEAFRQTKAALLADLDGSYAQSLARAAQSSAPAGRQNVTSL